MKESFSIQKEMQTLCQTKNWRALVGLIDDGYKGMFVILKILKENSCGVVAGELAKQMNVSTARIATALNCLERKSYIRREREKKDGRKVVIFLTEQGEVALENRKKRIEETVSSMFSNVSEQETIVFFELLNKILK